MKRWWPYAANMLGLVGCMMMLVSLILGGSMTHGTQIFWTAITAVWILNHAWLRFMYDGQVRLRKDWQELSERWRQLYGLASQKRRSMWS